MLVPRRYCRLLAHRIFQLIPAMAILIVVLFFAWFCCLGILANVQSSSLIDYDLFVEGWGSTGLSHSYSIVERRLLNALKHSKRSALSTSAVVRNVSCTKYFNKNWKGKDACMNRYKKANSDNLWGAEGFSTGKRKRIVLRFTFPLNFVTDTSADHTFVFATTEFYNTSVALFPNGIPRVGNKKLTIVTPSLWSKRGFLNGLKNLGIDNVEVLPHGVDTNVFKPIFDDNYRMQVRRRHFGTIFGLREENIIDENTIIILSVGAMTWNKGIDLLLEAFVRLCLDYEKNCMNAMGAQRDRMCTDESQKYLLALKGNDHLYDSHKKFLNQLNKIPGAMELYDKKWIVYSGAELCETEMSDLYGGSDIYVSPYRAEAFNMPVFEAIASGLLVVVTDYYDKSREIYSPTHEWIDDAFALRIKASLSRVVAYGNPHSYCFEPDKDDLYAKLRSATSYGKFKMRFRAKLAGPQYIKSYLTWHIVAQHFLKLIDKKVYDKPFIRIDEPRGNMVFASETTSKDGLAIKILIGFGDGSYRQRHPTSLWQICVQSKKLPKETLYAVPKFINRNDTENFDHRLCKVVTLSSGYPLENRILHARNTTLELNFQLTLDRGPGSYNIEVGLNRVGSSFDRILKSFEWHKSALIHVLEGSENSELYSLNLIEAGHYDIGKFYFVKNTGVALPNAQLIIEENSNLFVRYMTLMPPMMYDAYGSNDPAIRYREYIRNLKLLSLYSRKRIVTVDLRKYPAVNQRQSFTKQMLQLGGDGPVSGAANSYSLLPNVFLSYYKEQDSTEYKDLVNDLIQGWLKPSSLIYNINHRKRKVELQSPEFSGRHIGFVSFTMYTHSVGKLMIGTIRELSLLQSQESFSLYVFLPEQLLDRSSDIITQHLKRFKVHIIALSTKNVYEAADAIKERHLDVLVYTDLGIDPFTYVLSFLRLAPVQTAFWGNPILPESNEIDYFMVSDKHKSQYNGAFRPSSRKNRAQVVRLKGIGSYVFRPTIVQPSKANRVSWKDQLRIGSNAKLLLVTQALCKIHPQFDTVLRSILLSDRDAHVVILAGLGPLWSGALILRLQELSDQFGDIDQWLDRVHILTRLSARMYADLIQAAYLMLNTFPYSGFTTNLEALSLHLPVITMDGTSPRSSQTSMLYRIMDSTSGLDEESFSECCIAKNVSQYVGKTLHLMSNIKYRDAVSKKISTHVDILFKQEQTIKSWVKFLQRVHVGESAESIV